MLRLNLKYVAIVFGIFLPFISSRYVNFFRKDYTYIEKFDAFYKVHWDLHGSSWNSAFLSCDDEGAVLFYPKVRDEWTLVKNLTNSMTKPPNVTNIFVGLHDDFGLGEFITVDGHLTQSPLSVNNDNLNYEGGNCILMNIDTGLYTVGACVNNKPDTPLPYVCKKVDDESCPTIDKGYKYIKSLKKCYKINRRMKTWNDAMLTCLMEGGLLTVIQNKAEANAVYDLLNVYSTYHVGVRRLSSHGGHYSLKGQSLDDIYHQEITDNSYVTKDYDCGAVYVQQNNYLSTTTNVCSDLLPFICEMEVNVEG